MSTASQHSSTTIAAQISSSSSWLKLWDMVLDHGPQGTFALQALYSTITKPKTGHKCSIYGSVYVVEDTYYEHYTINHTSICNPELVIDCLAKESTKVFDYMHVIFFKCNLTYVLYVLYCMLCHPWLHMHQLLPFFKLLTK